MAKNGKEKAKDEPNVKLVDRAKALGKGPINMGMEEIGVLPDEEGQRAGFYFADPVLLVRMFPERYKLITEKGK